MAFKKALIERALGAELSHHLVGYAPGVAKPESAQNHRNGASGKTVLTGEGPLRLDMPRDREGSFEPLLIPKHARRFTGFDDKVVARRIFAAKRFVSSSRNGLAHGKEGRNVLNYALSFPSVEMVIRAINALFPDNSSTDSP